MIDASRLATGSVDPHFNTATFEMGTVPSVGKNSVTKGDGKFSALKPGEFIISASLESAPTVAMACKTDSLAS